MSLEPAYEAFAAAYDAQRPQVVWTRLVDDLETPVSAYLKIAHGRPYAFLFESVEGGAWRGRYSIVAMKPDLVWRCRGDSAEIAEGEAIARRDFMAQDGGALDSLRDLVARSRIELPKGLPPMAAGVFGALGYDMVRLAEKLPNVNDDPLGLPDAVMIRPTIVAIFDAIAQEIVLVTTVRPGGGSAKEAYEAARQRLEQVMADLRRPLAHDAPRTGHAQAEFTTPVSRADYHQVVARA
ncbi:MAG TPA: anthranilate synthase component I, partial [Caulobacteraceae bacterium]|nr:anthranilate synthase component I [Caulobacteraceae bacterium]